LSRQKNPTSVKEIYGVDDQRWAVLKVFLASPEDLKEEREIANTVVERLNELLERPLDVHIDLLEWEDTLPGYGRPQEIINKDVDVCDLFVGLLWRWWGEPTGKYTSGFEEEFCRARERARTTGKPDIWLFFKDIDPQLPEDTGPQLTKVLQFRAEQQQAKELLFKQFKEPDDWEDLFFNCLHRYVFDFRKGPLIEARARELSAQAPATSITKKITPTEESLGKSYPEEIVSLIDHVKERVLDEGPAALDSRQAARLYLLATSWLSLIHRGELLEVHESNLFYAGKDYLCLAPEEVTLLTRSLVGDKYGVKPGYYWIREWSDARLPGWMSKLSTDDPEEQVRAGALRLLKLMEHSPTPDWSNVLVADPSATVRLAFLECIRARGRSGDADIVNKLTSDKDARVRQEALCVRLTLMALEDINVAFEEAIRINLPEPESFLSDLRRRHVSVSPDLLRRALGTGEAGLRQFAAEALAESGQLTLEEAKALADDQSPDVARIGLLTLISMGEQVDDKLIETAMKNKVSEKLELEFARIRVLDPEHLLQKLDFYDPDGYHAYRALALDHFSLIKDRIRSDLEDDFQKLREESAAKIRSIYENVEGAAETFLSQWKKHGLLSFRTAKLTAAALAGLSQHGDESHAGLVRRFLSDSSYDVKLETAKVISRFGNKGDAAALVSIATDSYGELKTIAGLTAVSLDPQLDGAAGQLLRTDDPDLVRISLKTLLKSSPDEAKPVVEEILASQNADIRSAAVSFLVRVSTRDELLRLLSDYQRRSKCYYTVVCLLDKELYAPGKLGERLRAELRSILE